MMMNFSYASSMIYYCNFKIAGVGYQAYEDGITENVFLKIKNDEVFIGKVWPNEAAFPDFYHPNTTAWWHKGLDSMYS